MYHKFFRKSTALITVLTMTAGVFVWTPFALALTPDDPRYNNQQTMYEQIGAPVAWDYTTGSKQVVVAVIDTGVDTEHNDLKQNIWVNPFEIPDNNYDDDNNGYIDDVNGWNFIEDNNIVRPSVLESDNDPEAVRHGTVVAGLVGAVGNNEIDGTGLNWNIRIMPLVAVDSQGNGSYAAVTEAIKYAVDNGADIITMSFVGENTDAELQSAITYAYKKGVVIVAAAGNNNRSGKGDTAKFPVYPLCMDGGNGQDEILGVGSLSANNVLSEFSNYGACVDIYAPGEGIFSTERYAPRYNFNDEFGGPWQGTSFATPLVAGTAALIKSLRPTWDAGQIYRTILDSASATTINGLTSKILNTSAAVEKTLATFQPAYPKFTKGTRNASGRVFLRGINGYPDKLIISLSRGKVVWSQDFVFDYGKRKGVVALWQQNKYYYFSWQEINGPHLSEYSIGGGTNKKINKAIILPGYPIESVLLEEYNSQTKRTTFREFDYFGKKLNEKSIAGAVKIWQFDNGNIKYVQVVNKRGKLTTKILKWYTTD